MSGDITRRLRHLEARQTAGVVAGPIPTIELYKWPPEARAVFAAAEVAGDVAAEDDLIERYAGVRPPPSGTAGIRCIIDRCVMAGQCQGQNKDGAPCSATPQRGQGWCVWHNPALEAKRQAWSVEGGRNKSNKVRARKELADDRLTLRDTGAVLSRLLRKLEAGEAEPNVCTAAANLARALAMVEEKTTLADRLTALEEAAGITDRGGAA